jgi:hypothetical protein
MLTTYRSNSRLVRAWLGIVSILTFDEFCRGRSSGESSNGTGDLHVDGMGSCDFGSEAVRTRWWLAVQLTRSMPALYLTMSQSALACSHVRVTLLSRVGCALSISSLDPSSEHEVRYEPASALHSPVIVPLRQASQCYFTLIVRRGVHSPCLIEKLARTSHANICFIALGFLGDGLACMIA